MRINYLLQRRPRRRLYTATSGRTTSRKRATTGRSCRRRKRGTRQDWRKNVASRKYTGSITDRIDCATKFPPFKYMVVGRDQVEGEERKEKLEVLIAHENSMPQTNGRVHVKNPVSVDDRQVRTRKRGVRRTKANNGYQLSIARSHQVGWDGEGDRGVSRGETQKAL